LTSFEFQSLNFEKIKKPLPFQLWEIKREVEMHNYAPDPRVKYFRHDLVAVPVERFSMSGVHERIADTLTDVTALPTYCVNTGFLPSKFYILTRQAELRVRPCFTSY
jgi:hypothetical protein